MNDGVQSNGKLFNCKPSTDFSATIVLSPNTWALLWLRLLRSN